MARITTKPRSIISPSSTISGSGGLVGLTLASDWANRSTASGVVFATDHSQTSDYDTTTRIFGANDGGSGGPGSAFWKSMAVRDTTDGITGGACLKIIVPARYGGNGVAWIAPLNSSWTMDSQGFGTNEFFASYRFKVPRSWMANNRGWGRKVSIISGYRQSDPQNGPSHTSFEHVHEDTLAKGIPVIYRDTSDNTARHYGENFDSGIGDIKVTDQDHGSGSNADRYCLYNSGNYTAGCYRYKPNTWVAVKFRLKAAVYGGNTADVVPGNIMDFWIAKEGASTWELIYTARDKAIGPISDGYTGGFCGIWLLPYATGQGADNESHVKYTQLIVSTNDIACPAPLAIPHTPLEAKVLSMTDDEFSTLTMAGIGDIGTANSTIFEFQSNAWWDPRNRKIKYFGVGHTNGNRGYFDYRETTSDWSATDNTAPDGLSDAEHGYAGTALDTATGDMYWARGNYSSTAVYKRTAATGLWSKVTDFPITTGWMQAVWHPTIGGTGGLVVGSEFGIAWWNGSTWTTLLTSGGGTLMSSHAGASVYNHKDRCAYLGCTVDTNPGIYKIAADGTVTKIATPSFPVGVHFNGVGGNNAMLCASGNATNSLLAIRQNGEVYEYSETGDTWSSQIFTLPSGIVNYYNMQWFGCAIHDLGCIVFVGQVDVSSMSSTMYVWKH